MKAFNVLFNDKVGMPSYTGGKCLKEYNESPYVSVKCGHFKKAKKG